MELAAQEEITDARIARNQAWMDRMRGRISQAELFEVIRDTRGKYGERIYERQFISSTE